MMNPAKPPVIFLHCSETFLLKLTLLQWVIYQNYSFLSNNCYVALGAIAFMACRQKLCERCSESGQWANHHTHDKLFKKEGVILIIVLTWFISFISIIPDCLGLSGSYMWSNTFYGCDVVYCNNKKSYAMMANIILNVIIITTSYIKYSMRLMSESKAASALDIVPEAQRKFTQHIKMLMSLAIAYTVCVLPTSLLCWGQFNIDSWFSKSSLWQKHIFESFFNVLYWSMYSLNFSIYLASYSRIREAYRRFLGDMKQKVWKRKASVCSHSSIQDVSKLGEPNNLD